MAIELISKIKPKNNGNFKLVDASDVEYLTSNVADALGGLDENKISKSDIIDNLTSSETGKPLSAAQGKVLKGLIDGKGTGTGDMLKSTYDPDNDGKVEKAKYADTAGTATNATTATNANSLGNVASSNYATKTYVTTALGDYAKKTDLQNLGGGDMLASIYADASKTGYVKNATNADTATNATTADWAEEAQSADEAAYASNAGKLGGKVPSHYAANSDLTTLAGSVVGDQTWVDYYANTKSIGEVIGSWTHDRLKDTTIAEQLCILRDMLQTTGLYITFSINNWKTGAPKNTTWETFVSCDTEARYMLDLGKNGTAIINGDGESLYLNSTLVKSSDTIQPGKNYVFK